MIGRIEYLVQNGTHLPRTAISFPSLRVQICKIAWILLEGWFDDDNDDDNDYGSSLQALIVITNPLFYYKIIIIQWKQVVLT